MTHATAQGVRDPERTTAAVLHAPGDVRLEELDLPPMTPTDVLVEMRSGGICGSDVHYFASGRNGTNELRQPTVLGHEAAGVVVVAGSEARTDPGTPVAIEPSLPCGRCPTCRSGRHNVCPDGRCFGSPPTNGLFARYAVVPDTNVHALPDNLAPESGAIIEPLAVAVWAVERAEVQPGDRVLISGAGPIGLLVARVALARGAGAVTLADIDDARLGAARDRGIRDVIAPTADGYPLTDQDRFIECSGAPGALVDGLRTVRPAGRVTVVGQARPTVDGVPLGLMQRYEIDLVTAFRYAGAFPTAIGLVRDGLVDVDDVVTARYPLEHVAEALQAPTRDTTNLKVLISY
ncbi:alcohol dehydrogenase catalytic domain-containing protein [Actinotalea sp. K2]|uniref:alcohol dehydrogenase catalytic domain-containing protein n=1 Tax=Actinotalea sp. K2 TaxID=2939438 RepID=UPI0020180036|nr:alcohol dehydrogenase catalytic domain-containing protein [Actinotalea sp. K2]MCL3861609.1 alcohol dehydrogenase catalytic domain-containing protein [Actinotalea sp. K2]